MKRILLISAPLEESFKLKNISDDENSYSLGLGYLHSVIEKSGYAIKTKNYNTSDEVASLNDIREEISGFNPDYLLMQLFSMNRVTSYKVFKIAKELKNDIKVIIGGVHATIMYEQLLNNFDIDYAVLGEGEKTIVELLRALDKAEDTSKIRGISYRRNGQVVKTEERELVENLDELPFPKHELFITSKRKMACILTSRGCPFKCSFCCLHTISKRIYRKRSVDNIIKEIEYILSAFKNINSIQIADDTFTLDVERAMEFCKEIVKRNIKVKLSCSARIKPSSKEMFKLMEEAGFVSIGFGLETGSEKLLASIHKNITREDVKETFRNLTKVKKISITLYMMLGFPGESDKTVEESVNFLKELYKIRKFGVYGVAILWVYPNTEVFDLMKEKRLIGDDYWLSDKEVPYFTVEHSYQDLLRLKAKMTSGFFAIRGRAFFVYKGFVYLLKSPVQTVKKVFSLTNFRSSRWN